MKVPFLDLKRQYQSIKQEVEKKVLDVLESSSYIGGSYVQNFENDVAEYLDVKHAIGCASGTDALVLALRACGIKHGDEVITTPFTFFATAEAIALVGAVPVFVDVRYDDYNIDETKIEAAITEKTKAILPVHIFGAPCNMDAIIGIAKKYNLKVIEDDAQAIGSEYKGKKTGSLGDIGCFSFYPTKNLGGCGDGGLVTTNNDELAIVLKALHEHGAGQNGAKAVEYLGGSAEDLQTNERVTSLYNPYKYFNYLIGYNSRLDAIQAAILSIKLKHLDEYNESRAKIAKMYFEGLSSKIMLPKYSTDNKTCWHQFVVRSEYKEDLCSYLSEHEVGNGTFYPVPLHKQKAFDKDNCRISGQALPVAEKISAQSVCLPIFPEMSEDEVKYVIETVNSFYEARK